MTTPRRALAISLASQYVTLGVQFVATIIIARLLTPAEIGIFSIAAAFIALAHLLREFGSGTYIIQEKHLTHDRIRAAFFVTMLLGWSMAAAVYFVAPWVAHFYNEHGIEYVLTFLTINFLLTPFGSITMAYQQRQVNMMAGLVVKTSATLMSAAVSIACAYAGQSYMSLAWGSIAGTVTSVLLAQWYRPPQFPLLPGIREARRVLSFGGKMSLVTVLNHISGSAPELIIGKMLGIAPVGLFSRAQGLIGLFSKLVTRGMAPALIPLVARAHRGGNTQGMAHGYLYGVSCLTGLAWPFYAGLGVAAEPLIGTLFGPAWLSAAPLVSIWAVAGLIQITSYLSEQMLIATGSVGTIARIQSVLVPVRIVLILGAATISIETVIATFILSSILRAILLWPHVRRELNITSGDYLRATRSSLLAACLVGLGFAGNAWLWQTHPEAPYWQVLLTGMASGGVVLLASLRATAHPLMAELTRAVRIILTRLSAHSR